MAKQLTEEQITKVQEELKSALGYSMEMWLVNEITAAIENPILIEGLFDDYYESSLKYFGVKKLNW